VKIIRLAQLQKVNGDQMKRKFSISVLTVLFAASVAIAADAPKVGDTVWAQWRPNVWLRGAISNTASIGFHVRFDNFDERALPPSLIAVDTPPKREDLKPATRVVAIWHNGKYYPATITDIGEKTCFLQFDDGDQGEFEFALIRLIAARPDPARAPRIGDIVWAQWRPNSWYHGTVAKLGNLGLHIVFDDGDEADLAPALVVLDEPPQKENVKVGARVLAVWNNGNLYPATVREITDKKKYILQFDGGDRGECDLSDLRLLNE
jgi:hypothetical protein